jgi:hypothetical protein
MSGLRRTSYSSQKLRGPTLDFEQRSTLGRMQFSLFELSSRSSERCSGGTEVQFNPGCTTSLMKHLLKLLYSKPLSLLLLIVLVLSAGIALHLAGPIFIQTHRVELLDVEIHIGNTQGVKPSGSQTATPEPHNRRHRAVR